MPLQNTINVASLIGYLKTAGACEEGISWLVGEFDGCVLIDRLIAAAPKDWILWAAGRTAFAIRYRRMISQISIDRAATAEPWAALAYAPHLVSRSILDAAARRYPVTALRCAQNYLSPEVVGGCKAVLTAVRAW